VTAAIVNVADVAPAIGAPLTPHDARALMAAAVADPDPVLYYEHIALYRDPKMKQTLADEPPAPIPLGKAALRRAGKDLAIVSYGAYVHTALRVAERLAADGIEASVLDLRSLAPLDRDSLLAVPPLLARPHRRGGHAHRLDRRIARRDHPGGGVRVPRRTGADRRFAGYARTLLAAAGR
jgi:hypothetical protein